MVVVLELLMGLRLPLLVVVVVVMRGGMIMDTLSLFLSSLEMTWVEMR